MQMLKSLDANPRFYDRLNAVCSVILFVAVAGLAFLALQPSMNPPAINGRLEIRMEPAAADSAVGTVAPGSALAPATVSVERPSAG